MNSVLVIDDEKEICESIKMILEYEDYEVDYSTEAIKGVEKLTSGSFDVALLDIQMPDMNGFEVLNKLKELKLDVNVIIISAFSSLENAVKATKLGAFDFLEKPIDRDKLLLSIRNALSQVKLVKENKELKKSLNENSVIIGKSPAIENVLQVISRVAQADVRVLITGGNGTGKELVAREIHRQSQRAKESFVEVNCAAIPNELIESELFGHEKGSFTGAFQQRIGKFELANKGTLFLDEIGDMSLQAQAKVLRAIEDGKIERVGGNRKIDVDVRIISATNKNLKEEIEKGNFREDLYHRLNVIPIVVPPLKDRVEDIPLLVAHFAHEIHTKYKIPPVKFTPGAVKALQSFEWTGNVRELRNIIERIIIMMPQKEITDKDVFKVVPPSPSGMDDIMNINNSFQDFKEKAERAFILRQLEANDWNISKTAELLDIQRSHLYAKMKKYDIEKGRE
ncbi:MAG: sigma-54-dependent Fis family transcriptional regulator [Ignavibacteria bacterium]|jgi:DNA-binding NtrC family response regulator|nr:sigma-54-dependent Fis family transcriptional regulator [Ignavibacteria bacterium]MCU7505109.1 sigma-54-dependent Fis family transcriptional regulator [Ignavibacteria bacterium]MCU7518059.1 sigma-54-dependent Fis family transcriptional regulator [Ignavibacteria bacterium]